MTRYGFEENTETQHFHQNRRMFCVYQERLRIAEKNVPYSHVEWFEKEGWMVESQDLMNEIMRGMINSNGNIYFYIGYDFQINDVIEKIFFSHLQELNRVVQLSPHAQIFGGMIKGEVGVMWKPRKEYGMIKDYL